jgi:hypothetical protein
MNKDEMKIRGLFTNPNAFSEVPAGSLSIADNVVINKESVVETRNGQNIYNNKLEHGGDISKLFNYRKTLLLSYCERLAYDNGEGEWVNYQGAYLPPEGHKMASVEANRNFYFTTSNGIFKLDAINSGTIPRPSGAIQGLDGSAVLNSEPTGSAVDPENQYAYRIVWGYRDQNNNLILGAPSQRIIVTNTDDNFQRNVDLTFTIPSGITTEWFYQIYRSGASGGVTIEPDDELQLVIEDFPTNVQLAEREITVTDITPNDLRGATLYTSPSQQGIAQANYQPPFATDMTVFKDQVLYANCKSKARTQLTLISVDSPSLGYVEHEATLDSTNVIVVDDNTGIRIGMRVVGTGIEDNTFVTEIDGLNITLSIDTTINSTEDLEFQDYVAISDQMFFCGSIQDFETNTFLLENSGSVGFNIGRTALNFVQLVNNSDSNDDYYAYYQSGFNDKPGMILIEERTFSEKIFNVTSSNGRSFNPILPIRNNFTTSDGTVTTIHSPDHGLLFDQRLYIAGSPVIPTAYYDVTIIDSDNFSINFETTESTFGYWVTDNEVVLSDNDQKLNRIYFSKIKQPEAVPLLNFVDIGSADDPIIRVVALRDSVLIFKRDGVYILSGDDPTNFYVSVLDSTVTIRAPESVVTFNNQVYAFSNQGVVSVSDAGVAVMSRPIENILLQVSSEAYTNFDNITFSISYESNRQYILFTGTEPTDTYATQAFVYNAFTNTWTRWVMDRVCGIVNTRDNKLYMGNPVNDYIYKERKEFTRFDYADESFPVTITNIDEDFFTLDNVEGIEVGMSLRQNDDFGLITFIDGNDVRVITKPSHRWEEGSAEVYKPIDTRIKFQPNVVGAHGMLKHFREMTFIFIDANFENAQAVFTTNFKPSDQYADLIPRVFGGWGTFSWGTVPWGGVSGGQQAIRVLVPRDSARGLWINTGIILKESFTNFSLAGVSITYNMMSERFK